MKFQTVCMGTAVYRNAAMQEAGVAPHPCVERIYQNREAKTFHILGSRKDFDSLAGACAFVESNAEQVSWWAGLSGPEGEATCPVCEAWNQGHLESHKRHPLRLCPVCVLEAVDGEGFSLSFENTGPFGGFVAKRIDTSAVISTTRCFCWVRGHKCHADEARFGGIVVELVLP